MRPPAGSERGCPGASRSRSSASREKLLLVKCISREGGGGRSPGAGRRARGGRVLNSEVCGRRRRSHTPRADAAPLSPTLAHGSCDERDLVFVRPQLGKQARPRAEAAAKRGCLLPGAQVPPLGSRSRFSPRPRACPSSWPRDPRVRRQSQHHGTPPTHTHTVSSGPGGQAGRLGDTSGVPGARHRSGEAPRTASARVPPPERPRDTGPPSEGTRPSPSDACEVILKLIVPVSFVHHLGRLGDLTGLTRMACDTTGTRRQWGPPGDTPPQRPGSGDGDADSRSGPAGCGGSRLAGPAPRRPGGQGPPLWSPRWQGARPVPRAASMVMRQFLWK